jgi:hypothetical protein
MQKKVQVHGMVALNYNPNPWMVEPGRLEVQSQAEHSEMLSQASKQSSI